ncbi:hypothetical protein [Arthrobacter sp. TS-15]|nr:hypothetical protein [Arthrobacter sp. TS-15]
MASSADKCWTLVHFNDADIAYAAETRKELFAHSIDEYSQVKHVMITNLD